MNIKLERISFLIILKKKREATHKSRAKQHQKYAEKYVYMEAEGGAMRSSTKYIQNSPRAGSFIFRVVGRESSRSKKRAERREKNRPIKFHVPT